jgi:hypothetical protein
VKTLVRTDTANLPIAAVLICAVGLVVLMESAFAISVKLPGHRAFPGALALLVAAQTLAPLMLVAFAMAVSGSLLAMGLIELPMVAVWLVPALALAFFFRERAIRWVGFFILAGLAFGLARYLSLSFGFHKTPSFIRLGSHLAFGALGGLSAYASSKLGKERMEEEL